MNCFALTRLYTSRLSLSRLRLSRLSENLVPVLQNNKITWKRGEISSFQISSFPKYFQYISNFRSQITHSDVKCGCLIYFFLNSANLVCLDTDISKCFRESLDFKIPTVDLVWSVPLFIYTIHAVVFFCFFVVVFLIIVFYICFCTIILINYFQVT